MCLRPFCLKPKNKRTYDFTLCHVSNFDNSEDVLCIIIKITVQTSSFNLSLVIKEI